MTQPPPRETDKDKLIQIIGQRTQATTAAYERAKAEFLTLCVEDLIKSIDNNSQTSHALARKKEKQRKGSALEKGHYAW
jgi:hypothetical protein